MVNPKIVEAIKKLREGSKKRNFSQTLELIVNLRDIDTKKPENRFTEIIVLPKGRGKEASIVVFSATLKEDLGVEVLSSAEIQALTKREAKKLAKNTDFFLSEPRLMPVVGKFLGQYLGPRGKMPKVLVGNVKAMIENYKKSIRLRIKDSPVIQCLVGKEDMKDEDLVENIEAVLDFLENKLPKGKANIKNILIKFTMSKPVEIKV
jgi:large subunit ribosomal protein L1